MTEATVSFRVPRDTEKEVEAIMREEHLEKSAALRKLLFVGLENYRQERALRLLADRKATLSRAAEIAHVSIWEMLALVRDRRILWVDDDQIEDVRAVLRKR